MDLFFQKHLRGFRDQSSLLAPRLDSVGGGKRKRVRGRPTDCQSRFLIATDQSQASNRLMTAEALVRNSDGDHERLEIGEMNGKPPTTRSDEASTRSSYKQMHRDYTSASLAGNGNTLILILTFDTTAEDPCPNFICSILR
jgi:hypothetical protein